MPDSTHNPSDDKPLHSHSGDEPKPQGAFKTISYDDETGEASVKVTPASPAAQAMAAGEDTAGKKGAAPASGNLDDMTVAELHQRASDLNIEGRSELKTKDDLVKAIRAAERRAAK